MKETSATTKPEDSIVRELVVGLGINAALTVAKFIIGTSTHCAALVADGFKDLAGAVRSGLKLEMRHLSRDVRTHKERPVVVRRIEMLLAIAVFAAITYMGIQSVAGSIKDAYDQHDTHYTTALFVISALSVVVKGYIAVRRHRLGKQRNDPELLADSEWAAVDSAIAGAILVTAVIDGTLNVDIDPWVGSGIGAVIIWYGIRTLWRRIRQRRAAA